ncbi:MULTISPECIES: C40 family peptidase [Streptomyces]|uniref:NlpC/P60 family protein n=1 Tax=Streptomyces chilikensis TaxID=1194079 RepID=A0ABV3EJ22_9ACTN|nr:MULTISPECIES: NlpC/P60 family protein [Streptomyces]MDH6226326.1 cell wall-associated NlpC family hydrolase [Streptomyces sp. MJP52]
MAASRGRRGGGPGRRGLIATAVALVCAITALGAPGTAFAGTHAPSSVSAPTDPAPPPAPAPASNAELEAVREKLDALYKDAARATEAYNAAEEKAKKQSEEIDELTGRIAGVQDEVDDLYERAGAAARAQYRGAGLPPEAKLWLSEDPEDFLDGARRVQEGEKAAKGLLADLISTRDKLEELEQAASARWADLEEQRRAKDKAREKIEKQIAEAEKLESRLQKEERERLAALEAEAARRSQAAWIGSGVLAGLDDATSASARRAIGYATEQLGKPYVWGAEGPDSFDCSGLTSQAWAKAGYPIPRTSQEQWRQLHRVAAQEMRPGDLIIYNSDATHVAIYVGDGMMIHAPRPGRSVTVAGAGSMPILGVVRPDPHRPSVEGD